MWAGSLHYIFENCEHSLPSLVLSASIAVPSILLCAMMFATSDTGQNLRVHISWYSMFGCYIFCYYILSSGEMRNVCSSIQWRPVVACRHLFCIYCFRTIVQQLTIRVWHIWLYTQSAHTSLWVFSFWAAWQLEYGIRAQIKLPTKMNPFIGTFVVWNSIYQTWHSVGRK